MTETTNATECFTATAILRSSEYSLPLLLLMLLVCDAADKKHTGVVIAFDYAASSQPRHMTPAIK